MGSSKFDIADYLDSKEMIAEYLNTVLDESTTSNLSCYSVGPAGLPSILLRINFSPKKRKRFEVIEI